MIRHLQVPDIYYGGRKITSSAILHSDGSIFWEPTLFLVQRANKGLSAGSIESYAQDLVAFLNVVGITDGKHIIQGFSGAPNIEKLGILTDTALQHALFAKSPSYTLQTTAYNGILLLITRLFLPIQAALLGFALRNRFRR